MTSGQEALVQAVRDLADALELCADDGRTMSAACSRMIAEARALRADRLYWSR